MAHYDVSIAIKGDKPVGLDFINPRTGKATRIGFESFSGDENEAARILKREADGRTNVTRAALSVLVHILDTQRTDGYRGVGNINSDEGSRLPNELKTAMRDAESAYFGQFFSKEVKKGHKASELDTVLSLLRDKGIYSTVKGTALKYYYFCGKLPCYYDGENPDKSRLLAVSAMDKLIANMVTDASKDDESLSVRLSEWYGDMRAAREDITADEAKSLLFKLNEARIDLEELLAELVEQETSTAAMVIAEHGIEQMETEEI